MRSIDALFRADGGGLGMSEGLGFRSVGRVIKLFVFLA